jgi:hypothetical protein
MLQWKGLLSSTQVAADVSHPPILQPCRVQFTELQKDPKQQHLSGASTEDARQVHA